MATKWTKIAAGNKSGNRTVWEREGVRIRRIVTSRNVAVKDGNRTAYRYTSTSRCFAIEVADLDRYGMTGAAHRGVFNITGSSLAEAKRLADRIISGETRLSLRDVAGGTIIAEK